MNDRKSENTNKKQKIILGILLILAGLTALIGVYIMTDIGQIMGVDKATIVMYFENNKSIMWLSFLMLIAAVVLNYRKKLMKTWAIIVFSLLWCGAIIATKYLSPYILFQTQQYNSEFISINDAHDYLENDDIVFVLDLNGVQKAYPRDYIWQAHIIGGDFADENVIFTYCVMSNLPIPYKNDLDGKQVDFKVLAQANNNLLIWETKSGEIIQQITNTCEFSQQKLEPLPVLEMTWAGFKKAYPKGTVFHNEWDRPMEKIMNSLFSLEETWYGDRWMFNTVNLEDQRLPSKEQIIGLSDEEEQQHLAFTKSFIKKEGIVNTNVGNKRIVLAYFPEFETIAAFDRTVDGAEIEVTEIDFYGQTPENGKLERVFIYNSVLWAVWLDYFPNTELIK